MKHGMRILITAAILASFAAAGAFCASDGKQSPAAEHNAKGVKLHMNGDLDGSIENFSKAVGLDPSLPEAWNNLAAVYSKKKNSDKMMETCLDACAHLPQKITSWKDGNFTYDCNNQYDKFDLRPPEEAKRWMELSGKAAGVKPGMTHDEVKKLLGEPDKGSDEYTTGEEPPLMIYSVKREFGEFETTCGLSPRDAMVAITFEGGKAATAEAIPNRAILFDAAGWKTSSPARRRAMIDDFIANHHPEKLTKEKLTESLGDPTPEFKALIKGWDMAWSLGPEWSFMAANDDWFVVRLDANGAVREFAMTNN